jgi:hypothetical protein
MPVYAIPELFHCALHEKCASIYSRKNNAGSWAPVHILRTERGLGLSVVGHPRRGKDGRGKADRWKRRRCSWCAAVGRPFNLLKSECLSHAERALAAVKHARECETTETRVSPESLEIFPDTRAEKSVKHLRTMTAVSSSRLDQDYEDICFEASDFPMFVAAYGKPVEMLTNAVTKTFLFAGQHGSKAAVRELHLSCETSNSKKKNKTSQISICGADISVSMWVGLVVLLQFITKAATDNAASAANITMADAYCAVADMLMENGIIATTDVEAGIMYTSDAEGDDE